MSSKAKNSGTAAGRPFKVLTRKALIGWLAAVFVVCGWMFVLGVLVGRDQAPIEFDLQALEKTIAKLRGDQAAGGSDSADNLSSAKAESQLGFYEALPANRKDTTISKRAAEKADKVEPVPPPSAGAPAKVTAADRPSSTASASQSVPGPDQTRPKPAADGSYSVQAASVKNLPDADRLVGKLKSRGFPAFRATTQIEDKGTWHRVRIGPYAGKEEAGRVLEELRQAGMKPILVKTK